MSLTRSLTRSITRGLTRGLTVGGGGGGADPGVALLAEARIYIDWSDAANHSGKYAINQNDPRTVTPNVLAFPTGPIVNEAGSANPARTNNYVNGPGGTLSATRITSNGTNQVCYLCRPSHRHRLAGRASRWSCCRRSRRYARGPVSPPTRSSPH